MRAPPRTIALIAVVLVVVMGTIVFGVVAASRQAASRPPVDSATGGGSADLHQVQAEPHVVFRSTAPDDRYGTVALVPLDAPDGPRAFTDRECDRVDATTEHTICLHTILGATFQADLLDSSWQTVRTWPLAGLISRTRFSPDGTLFASTVFVAGHAYATGGFVTQTKIEPVEGEGSGDLEGFAITVDGQPFTATDRNIWGVTFVDDDAFYATVASASAGKTWLARGSLTARTLTALRENVECPSISPDGTRIAYKQRQSGAGLPFWSIAVLDLASDTVTVLDGEQHSVDDQVEWLDDSTLLYGLPRESEPGVTDVWSIPVAAGAAPSVFIPQAWSPAVVRP